MLKGGNCHCAVKKNGKGKKNQVTYGEKPGVEQIGEDGKAWVKTAKGSATTVTCSCSEIRVQVDTP